MSGAADNKPILALNAGSSSLKFALYDRQSLTRLAAGKIERVGQGDSRRSVAGEAVEPVAAQTHGAALERVLEWIETAPHGAIAAIGHRIVHGGPHHQAHCLLDASVVGALRDVVGFAPEHLPAALDLIDACATRFDGVPQIGCFDTAFHRDMPAVASRMALPRRFFTQGVRRYGFHGLSCAFVLARLGEIAPALAKGRLIVAHIGSGVSLTAVRDGRSIDTTMGLTPAAGVPMGTRSGDLDPGLVRYLAESEGLDASGFDRLVNHEAGLLGVSETSADVRDLLAAEATDRRAEEALALFCYRLRQAVGSLAASLGGLDALVFTGGVGENAPQIRARVCAGLEFLGIELDPQRNADHAGCIARPEARVAVHVIATDEEAVIAQAVADLLNQEKSAR